MLAALPMGVVLLDGEASIIELNPAAHRLLGLGTGSRSLRELRGRVGDPVSGTPLRDAELPWQRALAGNSVHDIDLMVLSAGHEPQRRLITVSARPFIDPGAPVPGALVFAVDRVSVLLRQTRDEELPPYLRRVLALLGQGYGTSDIARELHLTLATTRLYIKRIYSRLGLSNRSQAALRAIELGLVEPELKAC